MNYQGLTLLYFARRTGFPYSGVWFPMSIHMNDPEKVKETIHGLEKGGHVPRLMPNTEYLRDRDEKTWAIHDPLYESDLAPCHNADILKEIWTGTMIPGNR